MAALSLDVDEKWFPALGEAPAKLVLRGVRLAIRPGERVALIGPSGCGKTTLLNIVAGLDRRFSGRIVRDEASRLAYVFQEPRLLPWRTVEQNLAFVLEGVPDVAARIASVLNEVGLGAARHVYASRLSLGMARRAAIARAFVVEPGLLLLDEPFVSLDELTAQRLRLLLLELLDRHRTTALFVTHALAEAVMIADRLVFLATAPAEIVAVHEVPLTAAERRQPAAVASFRERLVEADRQLAALVRPSLDEAHETAEILA